MVGTTLPLLKLQLTKPGFKAPQLMEAAGTVELAGTVESAGQVWMDRNLGADQVATSSTDSAAYGDLYQWGRKSDGHENRESQTTADLSTVDNPGHPMFILGKIDTKDWRDPQNSNLWQEISGPNNPCPAGFRIPTKQEWEVEWGSWSTKNAAGAFSSPLKLTKTGVRQYMNNGNIVLTGQMGF